MKDHQTTPASRHRHEACPHAPRFSPRLSSPRRLLAKTLIAGLFSLQLPVLVQAASYYCDPASGSMSNAGTSAAPWSTLEGVFTSGKTFVAGDVIYLRNGYHGAPTVTGNYTGAGVTIQPQSGHSPKLKTLVVSNASHWTISDLDISPANAGVTLTNSSTLVTLSANSSDITLQRCAIHSVADTVDVMLWTVADWSKAASGISVDAPRTQLISNTLTNVYFGINVNRAATGSLVTENVITNFSQDGMRGLANNCTFSYNTVQNAYLGLADDINHDDAFQSWSVGADGIIGHGTVSNVVVRGNTFIAYTNPAQPFKGDLQGIGCFDGMFDGWIVENNLVIPNLWNGIALYGATNCRFVNNTVVKNPLDTTSSFTPWLGVFAHKSGTPASGNTIRNNLSTALSLSGTYTADHNITTTAYTSYFVDYAGLDFRLKSGSPAIDTGSTTLAPSTDIELNPRTDPYDVGCYEFIPPNANSGIKSLRGVITTTTSFSNTAQVANGIPTGSSYVASLWIKGTGSVRLTVRAGSWGTTLATLRCDATSTWTKVTTPAFTTGANTQLTFVVQDQYGVTGTSYIDDAFLGVSGGANVLANPGFESGAPSWSISSPTIWSVGAF